MSWVGDVVSFVLGRASRAGATAGPVAATAAERFIPSLGQASKTAADLKQSVSDLPSLVEAAKKAATDGNFTDLNHALSGINTVAASANGGGRGLISAATEALDASHGAGLSRNWAFLLPQKHARNLTTTQELGTELRETTDRLRNTIREVSGVVHSPTDLAQKVGLIEKEAHNITGIADDAVRATEIAEKSGVPAKAVKGRVTLSRYPALLAGAVGYHYLKSDSSSSTPVHGNQETASEASASKIPEESAQQSDQQRKDAVNKFRSDAIKSLNKVDPDAGVPVYSFNTPANTGNSFVIATDGKGRYGLYAESIDGKASPAGAKPLLSGDKYLVNFVAFMAEGLNGDPLSYLAKNGAPDQQLSKHLAEHYNGHVWLGNQAPVMAQQQQQMKI